MKSTKETSSLIFRPQIRSPTREATGFSGGAGMGSPFLALFPKVNWRVVGSMTSTLRPAPLAALADYQSYFDVERGEYLSGQDIARLDQLELCRLFHWQVASLRQTFSISFLLLPHMTWCGLGGGGGAAHVMVVNSPGDDRRGRLRRTDDSDKKVDMAEEDRERVHTWLSPPDTSTNHNTALATRHEGTAAWFFQGSIFRKWKNQSGAPVLWIQGKCAPCLTPFLTPSHTVLYL